MPIPAEALLDDKAQEDLKSELATKLHQGKIYWRPLHARQDYWAGMYFLLDVIQQTKPFGYRRFISNEPRTAVDAAVSILTRNDSFWRIDLNQLYAENPEERERIGKIERTLQGVVNYLDELLTERSELPLWKQAAFQALVRGWIWMKCHVTTDVLEYQDAPIMPEIWDSRLCYPHFDQYGLNSIIAEKPTTIGDLAAAYPELYRKEVNGPQFDPNAPVVKLEYWTNSRKERPGIASCLAVGPDPGLSPAAWMSPGILNIPSQPPSFDNGKWLIPPHEHGYDHNSLPIFGVPVNGVPIRAKPELGAAVTQQLEIRSAMLNVHSRYWQGPHSWVAESGRSILSSVEEEVPQYNELVATIFHHFSINAFGTWLFKTPTGELPNVQLGIEARIPMRPEESVERLSVAPISADAYRLLDILRDEQQKGTLSSVLRATLPGGQGDMSSGILFQQMTNSALNALEPFHDGIERFGQRLGTSVLSQLQQSSGKLKKFYLSVAGAKNTFFQIEFDPKADLERGRKYRARPIFRPALPDDMAIRIQTARVALDPRRPVLSLVTVLERILQLEDPSGEVDRIWEDIANTDPLIVLEHVALVFEKYGEEELATRIRESQYRMKFAEEMQWRQQSGNVPQLPSGQGPPEGAPPGMPPESGVPQSTTRTGNETDQMRRGAAAEGAQIVGAIGERMGV